MNLQFVRKNPMFFKTQINWWIIALLGALLASLWGVHTVLITAAVERSTALVTASLTKEYQDNLDKAVLAAAEVTKKLQSTSDSLKDKKYAKLETVNRNLSVELISLQQRTQRPIAPPIPSNNPASEPSCTGAQLYREDAEFLTREAARAEGVLIERDYYYDQYESIRKRLSP